MPETRAGSGSPTVSWVRHNLGNVLGAWRRSQLGFRMIEVAISKDENVASFETLAHARVGAGAVRSASTDAIDENADAAAQMHAQFFAARPLYPLHRDRAEHHIHQHLCGRGCVLDVDTAAPGLRL